MQMKFEGNKRVIKNILYMLKKITKSYFKTNVVIIYFKVWRSSWGHDLDLKLLLHDLCHLTDDHLYQEKPELRAQRPDLMMQRFKKLLLHRRFLGPSSFWGWNNQDPSYSCLYGQEQSGENGLVRDRTKEPCVTVAELQSFCLQIREILRISNCIQTKLS